MLRSQSIWPDFDSRKTERAAALQQRFITLEGIEGVGKTTNLEYVAAWLREREQSVVITREPGGTAAGEKIRSVVLDSAPGELSVLSELLLMFAARAVHLETLIKPALLRGDWVICDRFTDATYAYQGYGSGASIDKIAELETLVQQGFRPGLTILLDAPIGVSNQRRAARNSELDRFEVEPDEFFDRVQSGYRELAAREPDRIRSVDAGRAVPEVQADIGQVLTSYFKNIVE